MRLNTDLHLFSLILFFAGYMFSQDTGVRETYFSLSYTIVDEEKMRPVDIFCGWGQ